MPQASGQPSGATLRRGVEGRLELPEYDGGWIGEGGLRAPFLSTLTGDIDVNWSTDLEGLHEEASRTHFLDRWTRRSLLDAVGRLPPDATIADLGCSTGYLLEDLRAHHPTATLIGVDLIASGLVKAHDSVPSARLLQADVCELPLTDAGVDAVVSANLLEHVPDDLRALREVARIVRPGGTVALVVPAGRRTYDYYDRFLGHERRYGRGELAAKCRNAGLDVERDEFIGALLYPPFWLVKQRNRLRHDHLTGDALATRVAADISHTQDSRVGQAIWRLEARLAGRGVRPQFGIRSLVVARRPEAAR